MPVPENPNQHVLTVQLRMRMRLIFTTAGKWADGKQRKSGWQDGTYNTLSLYLKNVNVKQVLKHIRYLRGIGLGGIFSILQIFFYLDFYTMPRVIYFIIRTKPFFF